MRTKTLLKLGFLMIVSFQMGCKREKPSSVQQATPITEGDMKKCHQTKLWDSLQVHTKLIGKWEWEYIQCYWHPKDANDKDFKGLLIEFKLDNTLEVKVNGLTTQTSKWEVKKLDDVNFGIMVNPFVLQLPGRIFFCSEKVLFNDSYVDGCDNYFHVKH